MAVQLTLLPLSQRFLTSNALDILETTRFTTNCVPTNTIGSFPYTSPCRFQEPVSQSDGSVKWQVALNGASRILLLDLSPVTVLTTRVTNLVVEGKEKYTGDCKQTRCFAEDKTAEWCSFRVKFEWYHKTKEMREVEASGLDCRVTRTGSGRRMRIRLTWYLLEGSVTLQTAVEARRGHCLVLVGTTRKRYTCSKNIIFLGVGLRSLSQWNYFC